MIEDSEKLKSGVESKAESLADRLVPYTLGGTVLTWLLTRNVTKALAVLMVDFSCALKLAMPISVLSAIREAQSHHITVKGGKFLEAVSAADTIVFDKTGTLTKAKPTVVDVVAFDHHSKDELLTLIPVGFTSLLIYMAVVSPSRLEFVAIITSSTSFSSLCISSFSRISDGPIPSMGEIAP